MGDAQGPLAAKSIYEGLLGREDENVTLDDIPYLIDQAIEKLREQSLAGNKPPFDPEAYFWAQFVYIGA
jgi:hypothetical protein